MGCGCKGNDPLRRAKVLVGRKTWEQLTESTRSQLNGLYKEKFKTDGTDEQIIKWIYG